MDASCVAGRRAPDVLQIRCVGGRGVIICIFILALWISGAVVSCRARMASVKRLASMGKSGSTQEGIEALDTVAVANVWMEEQGPC